MLYENINNAISDKYVTQDLDKTSILFKPPKDFGPRIQKTDYSSPYLELFYPPKYQPEIAPATMFSSQSTSNLPQVCPLMPVNLRNHWESYNTTSGKGYGGYDIYSINNIPSCGERSGDYMNFIDSVNPWSKMYVEEKSKDYMAYDSHYGNWAETVPRNIQKRL